MRRILLILCSFAVGCSGPGDRRGSSVIVIASLDTLITTESAAIAGVADLAAAPDGELYIADWQANHLVVVQPTSGASHVIGGEGEGPGEFSGPWSVKALAEQVLVVDRGNGRLQRLTREGEYISSTPVTPLVRVGYPFLLPSGNLLIGTRGRDGRLAVEFDAQGSEQREIGTPVVLPPSVADFAAIKAQIREGEIPPDLRNEALVGGTESGAVWIALQTEGEVRRYGPDGLLEWTTIVDEPEMAATREHFFSRNAAEENPSRFYSLRYFRDIAVVEDDLWILMDTPSSSAAVLIVLGPDGVKTRRVEIAGAGGALAMAMDPGRGRLFLATSDDAQVVMADIGKAF